MIIDYFFYRKVLTDYYYKNKQCLLFCFGSSFEEEREEYNEIPNQRVFSPEIK